MPGLQAEVRIRAGYRIDRSTVLKITTPIQQTLGLFEHLTHKANLKHTRYGWLRLTPAYSVHLVSDLLDSVSVRNQVVLDPFCGTGTTALVCAERGIPADTTDINPFLIWLANTKTRIYQPEEITLFRAASAQVIEAIVSADKPVWVPPLHQIRKWWEARTLQALGRALSTIKDVAVTTSPAVTDLLEIVFCRLRTARGHLRNRESRICGGVAGGADERTNNHSGRVASHCWHKFVNKNHPLAESVALAACATPRPPCFTLYSAPILSPMTTANGRRIILPKFASVRPPTKQTHH